MKIKMLRNCRADGKLYLKDAEVSDLSDTIVGQLVAMGRAEPMETKAKQGKKSGKKETAAADTAREKSTANKASS